jgi:cytochrome c2
MDASGAIQLAIAQGRLSATRDIAAWLASQETSPALVTAAYSIERAGGVAAAASHLGELGRACSSCHEAARAELKPDIIEPAPRHAATLAEQSKRHQWAAARMWQGLLASSDEAWLEGAQLLAATPTDVRATVRDKPNAEVFELAERMQAQAERAATLNDHDERAEAYGELMHTCASCHDLTRRQPVLDKPATSLSAR